ncbi:hypothetical protein EPUS_03974 [Endocarpon pusillum Z07020]|uniref:polynucleotide adenylyltransferase n=1 Tax=Endocarpon pusillum (strain Z07020 / HMAS-L-300199) TaxID=1263415 RepID=U1HGK5_ENDPU|nr:uncharacterized protein EPUS_03974 [Endocarpon pusillum Z07020]ERF69270.1 hypothetical protein EPUS_03974 [Endocarpon pusillum Z07020]
MVGTKSAAAPACISPPPTLKSQQSTSLPSTPNQRPRDLTSRSRSPSGRRNASNPSPRSHHSDSLPLPPRRPNGGCKYETGMANAKRRVPYSLGPDKLDAAVEVPKASLSTAEDERLTNDMRDLYNQLLPSEESEARRKRLVEKLEMILRRQWPEYAIKVNVFGSTGNKLGTTESDVDICITTDCKELERVCVLAEFLANEGMQRVVCVSVAKVPIVKIWDPDLRLACDMNVNNPVALENTEMIRTYVDIDERVRPLAMIIKHWTKRRVLNEAALGGTLSSYTWICMIINFLQTRDPPVLPALQQGPFLQRKFMCGFNVAFDKDVTLYRGYGSRNKDSLGVLLFQFFRYYGHEVDFETSVMSVRTGTVITKVEKNWHFLQDNRLCVEEPFNTSRNLGNTADDTSVRGIHLELRRAFEMVSEANLAKCNEQYEPPANLVDALRPLKSHNASVNRPILTPPVPTFGRVARGGGRGGRQIHQLHRNFNPARRASSASTRGHAYSQPLSPGSNLTQTELSLQAQQEHILHDRLCQQYHFLQAQEKELRAQLHLQAVLQGRMMPTSPYPHFMLPFGVYAGGQEDLMGARAGNINQPPLSAPIRPHGFSMTSSSGGRKPGYGTTTNPPSPLLHTIVPDSRRNHRRSSMIDGSSARSLRAHSQPPRPVPSPLLLPNAMDKHYDYASGVPYHPGRDPVSTPGSARGFADVIADAQGRLYHNPSTGRRGSEYIGYYLGPSPPLPTYSRNVVGSPLTYTSGLGIQSSGMSPQMLAQLSAHPLGMPPSSTELSRSSSGEVGPTNPDPTKAEPLAYLPPQHASSRPRTRSRSSSGPVVVNGSVNREADAPGSLNTSASDDVAVETPTSSDDCSQGFPESHNEDTQKISDIDVLLARTEPAVKEKVARETRQRVNGHTEAPLSDDQLMLPIASSSSSSSSLENKPPVFNGNTHAFEIDAVPKASGDSTSEKEVRAGAFQLSPVKEVRTPSPTKTRQLLVLGDPPQGAAKARTKGKAKQKKSSLSSVDQSGDKPEALASLPNGFTQDLKPASIHGSVTGWQTQKRKSKHKKGSRSETDLKGVNIVGGDFLPLDESLRKGG